MISNSSFITSKEILNPNSYDYLKYWKEEKKRCIEGYWSGGKFMPPQLYFYINHWVIEMNKKDKYGNVVSGSKCLNNPDLRDLDWLRSYTLTEALGFSGFEEDTEYHSVKEDLLEDYAFFVKDKKYINPREYLKKIHKKSLGRPTYYNNSKNVFDLEARGGGKSMFCGMIVGQNYTFDGKTIDDDTITKSESLISGYKIDYVKTIASKIRTGLDSFKGQTYLGKYYPHPFSKVETGTLLTDLYNKKVVQKDGVRKVVGNNSQINSRTFGFDVFAANGLRPKITVIDEVGFMHNLKEVLSALVDCTYSGAKKFGVIWATGTGGEMEGKAVREVEDVFYNPETWDMLAFNDDYENKGKIGLFVPTYYTLNDFKDSEGITDIEKAKQYAEKKLTSVIAGKDQIAINNRMMNHPILPSHAFLSSEGNIYPINLLKDLLSELESKPDENIYGDLIYINNEVKFEINLNGREINFPTPQNQNLKGEVIIYEKPVLENGYIPSYKYIASTDPYNLDGEGASLGSTFIYKRSSMNDLEGDVLVAEYTGRPKTVKEYNEKVRLLCIYYNATNLYENQTQNIKEHFENKGSLNLLAKTPTTFKSTVVQSRTYGLNRTKDIRLELELYSSNWLIEMNPNGKLNYQNIKSKSLLKELIAYDGHTNTDRVIAFQIVIAYCISLTRKNIENKKESIKSNLFNNKFFV